MDGRRPSATAVDSGEPSFRQVAEKMDAETRSSATGLRPYASYRAAATAKFSKSWRNECNRDWPAAWVRASLYLAKFPKTSSAMVGQ